MRYAVFLSAILHVGVLAAGLIAWPFVAPEWEPYVASVPVELLSRAEIGDELTVPPDQKSQKVADKPKVLSGNVEVDSLPPPMPAPQPPEPQPEPEPEPEPAEPEQAKEPEPKKEDKRPDPPKKEAERLDDLSFLDDALKDLEDEETAAPAEVLDAEGLRDQERVGLGDKLTASELDRIRAAVSSCYNQPSGVPEADKLIVSIRFYLERDGTIRGEPQVLNARQIALSGNPWWRATRERAYQAVKACEPYDYLPQDRYYQWEEITLDFRPGGVM